VFEEDLVEALHDVGRRTAPRPVHLQAISWGTKLACATLIEHPELARSLTLIGPALVPKVDVSLVDKLKVACAMLTSPRRMFDIPLGDPRLFTDNPLRVRYIAEDPGSLRRCTARFLFQTRRLDAFVRRNAHRLKTPLLMMLAGRDRIVDNEAVRKLAERFTSDPKEVIVYGDAAHTLEFEPDPTPIHARLIAWLRSFENTAG
jgi:pimeloyl-ACP methyl ester carboxylesterase